MADGVFAGEYILDGNFNRLSKICIFSPLVHRKCNFEKPLMAVPGCGQRLVERPRFRFERAYLADSILSGSARQDAGEQKLTRPVRWSMRNAKAFSVRVEAMRL